MSKFQKDLEEAKKIANREENWTKESAVVTQERANVNLQFQSKKKKLAEERDKAQAMMKHWQEAKVERLANLRKQFEKDMATAEEQYDNLEREASEELEELNRELKRQNEVLCKENVELADKVAASDEVVQVLKKHMDTAT